MSEQARRDTRHPCSQELHVHCESWQVFAQCYAADVSQGGMFVITDEQLPILSEITLRMTLPEGHEIALKASVVHVIGPEQAARENRPAGVGLQFVELDAIRKQQIQQLVEFARWEGASARPSASYASRLFEVSASLPPSRVLDALASASDPRATVPSAPISARPAARSSARAPMGAGGPDSAGASDSASPRRSGSPSAPGAAASAPPKPSDPVKLKLGLTHLAHKRFAQAIKTFEDMLKGNPGDPQAAHWLHIANARLQLKSGDEERAAEHYLKALQASEDSLEARKFVRQHQLKKRLNSIPFGRYFVKKT